jgi:hypothetical protein
MITPSYRQIAGVGALALWADAMLLPALTICGKDRLLHGWQIAEIGWLGPVDGQFGWFANLFMLWIIIRLMIRRPATLISGLMVLILALSSFSLHSTSLYSSIETGGGQIALCERNTGFYFWIACSVLLFVVALIEWMIGKQQLRRMANT